jgi:general secretion pathway protein C
MKRLPIVLTLLALVALAATIAYWILQLYQPPQRPLSAAPLAEAPAPSIDAAATLFGGQAAAQVATNYQLSGVISAGNQSVAIISANGAPSKALVVGKEIAPGVTVNEVHARYVMLSDAGVMKRIDLAPDTKAAAPIGASAVLTAPSGAPAPNLPAAENNAEPEAVHPPGGGPDELAQPAQPAPPPAPNAPAPAPSAANPPLSPGAVPTGTAPTAPTQTPTQMPQPTHSPATQMPQPVRSPASPVSQPPQSR